MCFSSLCRLTPDALPGPYALHRPQVHLTPARFRFDKPPGDSATANTSLAFVAGCRPEVLVNGCVQTSAWRAPGTVLLKDKLRSRVCRIEVMRAYLALEAAVAAAAGGGRVDAEGVMPERATYAALKARNTAYAAGQRVIRGEPGAPVGPEWNLPHGFRATAGAAPFAGWIVAGKQYASFTAAGELREEGHE